MWQLAERGILRGIHYEKTEDGEMYPEDLVGLVAAPKDHEKKLANKQQAIQDTIAQLRKETGIR